MLTLPNKINTTMLISFWVVSAALFLALFVLTMVLATGSANWLWLLLLYPVMLIPVFMNPELAVLPYKLINRCLRILERGVLAITLKVIHTLFLPAYTVGSDGQLKLFRQTGKDSNWDIVTGESRNGDTESLFFFPDQQESGLRNFSRWSRLSNRLHYLPLVPLLFIISHLSGNVQKENVPEDMYTLY
jgi:hypothetical protein